MEFCAACNCSTKIGMKFSDLMSAFFLPDLNSFQEKKHSTQGLRIQTVGPNSALKIFAEIFQKTFQLCNNTTAQTQRRAPTHSHGHRDLTRKHLLATQRIVVEISIARAFTFQTSLVLQEVVETLVICHI